MITDWSTDEALTVNEVAQLLRVSRATVYNLRRRGELASFSVGHKLRISRSAVESYINSQQMPAEPAKIDASAAAHQAGLSNHGVSRSADSGNQESVGATDGMRSDQATCVISGRDVVVDVLANYLVEMGIALRRVYLTSFDSIIALYHDQVDIASAHLWDPQSGEYNIPYAKRLVPGEKTAIIRLVSRMQGFIVAAGNPKGLSAWDDLARADLTIANRERGSGSRILLDERLRSLGIDARNLRGYDFVSNSPLLLANRVANGQADLVIGTAKMARLVEGVEFIALQNEDLDLIIKQRAFDDPAVQALLTVMESGLLRQDMSGFDGLDSSKMGKIIWLN
ncbi:MAG: helix-turn-helix transcriptional regulator [Coriobacteriales bacterium]|jgi:putative molybdopterin biosynthesis protein|nr:helix-turn-helix transcriptional regulator [Coriobacteriales bacterium]